MARRTRLHEAPPAAGGLRFPIGLKFAVLIALLVVLRFVPAIHQGDL